MRNVMSAFLRSGSMKMYSSLQSMVQWLPLIAIQRTITATSRWLS